MTPGRASRPPASATAIVVLHRRTAALTVEPGRIIGLDRWRCGRRAEPLGLRRRQIARSVSHDPDSPRTALATRLTLIDEEGQDRSRSPSPHERTLMIVFPLRRSVELKAAT